MQENPATCIQRVEPCRKIHYSSISNAYSTYSSISEHNQAFKTFTTTNQSHLSPAKPTCISLSPYIQQLLPELL